MKEIQEHKIKIYEFPETDDEEEMKVIRKIKVCTFIHFYSSLSSAVVFSCTSSLCPSLQCIYIYSRYMWPSLLPAGSLTPGCRREQHHHRGQWKTSAREAVPMGRGWRWEVKGQPVCKFTNINICSNATHVCVLLLLRCWAHTREFLKKRNLKEKGKTPGKMMESPPFSRKKRQITH